MPHDSPLLGGHTLRSDEGSMTLHELMVLCIKLSNKVDSLETELKQTKQTYGAALTKLIKKVKKLEQTVKTSQAKRRAKIVVSDVEEREVMIEFGHITKVFGVGPEVTTVDTELTLLVHLFRLPVPQRHADTMLDDQETLAETLKRTIKKQVQISRDAKVAQMLQEEFDAAERQRMAQVHQAAQGFTDAEWDDVLARVAADEDFVQQLQAGEKCSEEDLPMKLVELVNQRKKFLCLNKAS
ncbi:hypothetical protein Tco_0738002 [Tanacetum coccineum]